MLSGSLNHLAFFDEDNALGPIQRDEALFLAGVVRVLRPQTIVEFGFSGGHSAVNFLQALSGEGVLFSYEIDPYAIECATQNLKNTLNFHLIPKSQDQFAPSDIEGRTIDFVFMDGAHENVIAQKTFKAFLPALSENAIIAVHDTGTWHRHYFLPEHNEFTKNDPNGWLDPNLFQHRREEREFVNWVANNYPEFQVIHFHSNNCVRHGITLMQKQRILNI